MIETNRLTLTRLKAPMTQDLAQIVQNPKVAATFNPIIDAVHDSQNKIVTKLSIMLTDGAVAYTARAKNRAGLIGTVFIQTGNLSYFVSPEEWKKGFGTEMVKAVIRNLQLGSNPLRLSAKILRSNMASRKILEKLGFVFSGLEIQNGIAFLNYKLHAK